MSNINLSANMNLPIPVVGVDPGPDWALNIDNCLTLLDGHDHSLGKGIPITPSGLNINSDLTFISNNAINLRSVRFMPQVANLSNISDVGCLYEQGVDLWYNDGSGNQVRITQSGGVAGSPGSISNLTSPASASYVAFDQTFVWQSAANTPANMDAASYIFRNLVANSNGLTLNPPNAMAANYSLTLPSLPSSTKILTIDVSGNITGSTDVASIIAPTGTITMFGGVAAPSGYLMCDGSSVSTTTYAALFGVIGNAYGTTGAGSFNLPDLRGKFPRGVDNGAGNDPDTLSRTAQGAGGNTGDNVGSVQGNATAANGLGLVDPGHVHIEQGFSSGGGATVMQQQPGAGTLQHDALNSPTLSSLTGMSVNSTDLETRPINVYVNFIIKT